MLSAATAVNAGKRKRRAAAAAANIPGLAPDIAAVAVADFTLEFKR